MPTAKRLLNSEGLRGTPASGSAPKFHKRGLKGNFGARHKDNRGLDPHSGLPVVYSLDEGVMVVTGGEAGLGGGVNTFPSRGASDVQYGDERSILDADRVPLGASDIAVLATFTVATGAGGTRTFEATPANAGGQCEVVVFARNVDTDEDGDQLHTVIINASGVAQTVTIPAQTGFAGGDTVAVYCRRVSAAPRSFGRWFGTRRTVVTVV